MQIKFEFMHARQVVSSRLRRSFLRLRRSKSLRQLGASLGGRPGIGGGFDSSHRPVVGTFDRFNSLSSSILLTFSCYFDNPQMPWGGHLNGNSQLSSNALPMPGLPPAA